MRRLAGRGALAHYRDPQQYKPDQRERIGIDHDRRLSADGVADGDDRAVTIT